MAPPPRVDQALPSQRAMCGALTPPAVEKDPPAYRFGPLPASKTTDASTELFMPLPGGPNADQLDPFQRAACGAEMPPAVLNAPPAKSAGPEPSSNAVSVNTSSSIPLPRADQLVPFQRAT